MKHTVIEKPKEKGVNNKKQSSSLGSTQKPTSTRETGRLGEKIACKYLTKNEWKILELNWSKQIGEIDIIAEKKGRIHFIEVKMRKSISHNPAIENFTTTKKKRFLKIGLLWATFHKLDEKSYQFDCITIEKKVTNWRVSHYLNIEFENESF